MKPDNETLALWLEDELEGAAQAEMEEWSAGEEKWLVKREEIRVWKRELRGVMPVSDEPPHAESFNARIAREIQQPANVVKPARSSRGWFLPLAAAAGMVLGFFMGNRGGDAGVELTPPMAELAPVLYTPEKGVEAELVFSEDATVIVLAGVDALPDSWEIPETAAVEDESDRTASSAR